MKFQSREVNIGQLKMGGLNPIRIQSMTNTNTLDVTATVEQSIRLIEAGCELVRITTPGMAEVEALKKIQEKIRSLGYQTPLAADVHFNPKVAEEAASFIEKVRINPGNYVDKKQSNKKFYTDLEYQQELNRIADRIFPLIEICKKHNTAVRIGVNHGSLSDRIINRYGNTVHGMAMSAIEFARIFQKQNFTNLVMSLKSSDVKTMIYSTRQFVEMMLQEEMAYPLHLGVTEAGAGEDGRIKSATGIGTLLLNGIGSTIRVSLTEAPEKEIPVAKSILEKVQQILQNENCKALPFSNKHHYIRRKTIAIGKYGGENPVSIITPTPQNEWDGCFEAESSNFTKNSSENRTVAYCNLTQNGNLIPLLNFAKKEQNKNPLILEKTFNEETLDDYTFHASILFGNLLIEGICDGFKINHTSFNQSISDELASNILQACGIRHTKAEIISCPSCGRTQYNIEYLLAEVKQAISHIKGLKIGVMGCVVNGPGEMADADYGLVGAGKDKVWLFKGQNVIEKNIESKEAVYKLIELLKKENRWIEK